MFLLSSPLGQGVLPIVPTPPRTHLPYHFLFLWFFYFFFAPQNPNFLSTILYNWFLFRGLAPRVSSESTFIVVEIHKDRSKLTDSDQIVVWEIMRSVWFR